MNRASCLPILGVIVLGACAGSPAASPDSGSDAGADATAGLDAGTLLPNLSVDAVRAGASARVVWQYFDASDCVIMEGCVEAAGWRRLLRFETFTPNTGEVDFRMGPPADHPELFEYSACHDHYHYNGYADYRLLDSSGAEAAMGHKQAFCLMDSEPISEGPGVPRTPQYDCGNQGISRGWGDNYYAALDCQWIDVTSVDPGSYTIRITINGERTIRESSYDDNVVMVPVTIPPDAAIDSTAACPSAIDGPRDCGWTLAASADCVPGMTYEVGCGAGCGLGTCGAGDDALLRVCPGEGACSSRQQIAYADDGCGGTLCPMTTFVCPAAGRYTTMTAAYADDATYSCTPAARLAP